MLAAGAASEAAADKADMMLNQIKSLHEELLSLIAELEVLTAADTPNSSQLTQVRWKLTRASSRRSKLLEDAVFPALINASAAGAAQMLELRESSSDLRSASSQHIAEWTVSNIQADWQGYRKASEGMRASMKRRIAVEKRILYPLLGAL
jgi:hypothetical protein